MLFSTAQEVREGRVADEEVDLNKTENYKAYKNFTEKENNKNEIERTRTQAKESNNNNNHTNQRALRYITHEIFIIMYIVTTAGEKLICSPHRRHRRGYVY